MIHLRTPEINSVRFGEDCFYFYTMRGNGVKRPQPSERVNMKHRALG